MTPDQYVQSLVDDGERIAAIGETSMPERVPSCPDWEVGDLVAHVGWVHRFLTRLVLLPDGGRATRADTADVVARITSSQRPEGEPAAWFRDGVAELAQALTGADPTATIHTYLGTHRPWVLARRAATETAIHRWDAEGAVGAPTPLAPALAADAIDEFLDLLVPPFFKYAAFRGTGQTIRLESTDGDHAWTVTVTADATDWRHSTHPAGAHVTARGSASDLYLFCWGRSPALPLEVEGDEELLARWQAAAAF